MWNAKEPSPREDAGKRLANALSDLEASLRNIEMAEMRARFEGFRRAMNQIGDSARGLADIARERVHR
jgi:hypothetical protein